MSESLPETLEQKYRFSAPALVELADWASFALEPDPSHPAGVINSLYYDTQDLALYHQKRSSEYLKFKVRLRWYGDLTGKPDGAVQAFLEVKRKIGATRRKQRTPVKLRASSLAGGDFDTEEVAGLANHAFENGFPVYMPLRPAAHIRYLRTRYLDPSCGARIAMDSNIRCEWFNQALAPLQPPAMLDSGVLEVKGRMRHLPRSLEPIAFLLQKYSFSKYAQCLEKLTYPKELRI